MKKRLLPALLLLLIMICVSASAQSPQPTQTPYIIYIVVTPTPEPVQEDVIQIQRPTEPANSGPVTIVNQTTTSNSYAQTTDELVQRVVATVVAQANTTAGGTANTMPNTATASGTPVRLSDGTTCSASFQLVSEPSYPAGSIIPRGEVFWKEWVILNTGTCTWTPDWSFVFDTGWQIGNTRFAMNRTTAPGSTLTVRLAMVPDQKWNGNYYSTYAFEAPDGTRIGTITSSYTVKDTSYFAPTPTIPPMKPKHGDPVWPPCYGPYCPPPPPCWDPSICPPPPWW